MNNYNNHDQQAILAIKTQNQSHVYVQTFKRKFIVQSSSIASHGISDNPFCLSLRLLLNFSWISPQLTIRTPSIYDRQRLMSAFSLHYNIGNDGNIFYANAYVFLPRSPKSRLNFFSTLCYKVNIPLGPNRKRQNYMNKGVARGECLRGGANIEWRFLGLKLDFSSSYTCFSKLISLAEICFFSKT